MTIVLKYVIITGGGFPAFFFGEKMFWFQIFLAFAAGVIISIICTGVVNIGMNILMLKRTHLTCLVMAYVVNESLEKMLEKRRSAMKSANVDDEILKIQKISDLQDLQIFQNTLINNLINIVSVNYPNFIEYSSWDEAMRYLKKEQQV